MLPHKSLLFILYIYIFTWDILKKTDILKNSITNKLGNSIEVIAGDCVKLGFCLLCMLLLVPNISDRCCCRASNWMLKVTHKVTSIIFYPSFCLAIKTHKIRFTFQNCKVILSIIRVWQVISICWWYLKLNQGCIIKKFLISYMVLLQ